MHDNRRLTLRIPAGIDDALANYAKARFQTKSAAIKSILVKHLGLEPKPKSDKKTSE